MRISMDFFWGLLFIIAGISLMAKYVFHINIPVIRILSGVVLIYLGLMMILGRFGIQNEKEIIFSKGSINITDVGDEYNIIFGDGSVNLTDADNVNKNKRIKVNTIFGKGNIMVKESIPAVIKVSSAFASGNFPDGTSIYLGDHTYSTKAYKAGEPYISIKASVVFGRLDIEEVQ